MGNSRILLSNCEINLILSWSADCIISSATEATKIAITDIKPFVAVVLCQLKIISNEEMDDIMKIVKSLEESGLLVEGVSETIKNEAKQQKGVIRASE